jgi:hypothetical protein
MEEMKSDFKIFVGNHEGKILLEGSRRRWENSFKIDLKEMG